MAFDQAYPARTIQGAAHSKFTPLQIDILLCHSKGFCWSESLQSHQPRYVMKSCPWRNSPEVHSLVVPSEDTVIAGFTVTGYLDLPDDVPFDPSLSLAILEQLTQSMAVVPYRDFLNQVLPPPALEVLQVPGSNGVQGFAGSFGGLASVIGLVLGGLLYQQVGALTFAVSAGLIYLAALLSLPLLRISN